MSKQFITFCINSHYEYNKSHERKVTKIKICEKTENLVTIGVKRILSNVKIFSPKTKMNYAVTSVRVVTNTMG